MAEYAERLESFPFDSSQDTEYDEDGYPIYDRAVGALVLRRALGKFFSNGVFPSPGSEMEVSAGDSGLTVNVAPGSCIIDGSIGTVVNETVLTLDTEVQGNTVYGIMVAFDNNEDRRSLYFRVAKGVPGSGQPPEPDRTTPNIYEYRIADVTLKSGVTSVSAVDVANNKGTANWPYAAPFEEIDVDGIVADFRSGATQALQDLLEYFETYRDVIDAALSEEAATHLQEQINKLEEQISNTDLSDQVDGTTIKYDVKLPTFTGKVLQVVLDGDGGVASSASLQAVAGDLATIAYEFHRDQLDGMDLDSIVTYEFPDDVASSAGVWDAGGKRYYANAGTEA